MLHRPLTDPVVLAVVLGWLACVASEAQVGVGDVWLVSPATAPAGGTCVVELRAEMGSFPYGAGQFSVRWNPALLAVDPGFGISGVSGGAGSPGELSPTAVHLAGAGELVFNSFTARVDLQGVVHLHSVGFRVLGAVGARVDLELEVQILGDVLGQPVPPGGSVPRPGGGASFDIIALACGDVDGDTDVDILDALACAQASLGLLALDPVVQLRSDVDGDGDTDVVDALRIARFVAGLPVTFECQPGGSVPPPPLPPVDPGLAVGDFDLVHHGLVASGTEFEVRVHCNTGVQVLGAYTVTLTFDPAVVHALVVEPSSTSLGDPTAVSIDNPGGQVIFNDLNLSDPALQGVLHVATVRFTAVGPPGAVSPMGGLVGSLVDLQLADIGPPAPRAMVAGAGTVELF